LIVHEATGKICWVLFMAHGVHVSFNAPLTIGTDILYKSSFQKFVLHTL